MARGRMGIRERIRMRTDLMKRAREARDEGLSASEWVAKEKEKAEADGIEWGDVWKILEVMLPFIIELFF